MLGRDANGTVRTHAPHQTVAHHLDVLDGELHATVEWQVQQPAAHDTRGQVAVQIEVGFANQL